MHPDPQLAARTRRQQVLLLVVVNSLVLAVAITATLDLRRLQTPGGTALRWVQAAVFGNCDDYLQFSVPAPDVQDSRSRQELCRDLRLASKDAQNHQLSIGLHPGAVVRAGSEATAEITLTRAGASTLLNIHLVRRSGRWRVLRDAATCSSVGCA